MFRFWLIFLLLLISISISAQKTDWVFMEQDNQILCEIKHLEFGKLRVKGYEMGTVKIEWDAVDSIYSEKDYLIRLIDGTIIESRLDDSWYSKYNVNWDEIIEIYPLEDQFIRRIEGEIDIGMNYTKSSEILQLNLYGDLSYHNFKNSISLYASNITTLDAAAEESEKTKKKDIDLVDDFFLPNNYLFRGNLGYEQNTELGINGRLYAAGGLAKELLHSQQTWMIIGLGAQGNREWSTDEISKAYNVEGIFVIEYKRFSFDFPELDISSSLKILPNLSDWGRVRTDFDLKVKIEIISDFFIGAKLYHTLDNKPIDASAANSDWGVSTSIGISF